MGTVGQWCIGVITQPLRLMGFFLVSLVLILYGWAWYTFVVVCACRYVFPENPVLGVFYILLFHVSYVPMVISYLKCVYGDPGTVTEANESLLPKGLDPENPQSFEQLASETKRNGGLRFCRKCRCYKPDRSHHCSICNKCILKMDHHCPWVSNCVGFSNHKYFFLFLVWTEVMCLTIAIFMFPTFYKSVGQIDMFLPGTNQFSVVLIYGFAAIFSLGVGGFSSFHVYLLLNGTTTIEMYEQKSRFKGGKRYFKYDLGKRRNFEEVLGKKPMLWFWPTREGCDGDGIVFPMREDSEDS